jgi:hypothetical protein
METTLKTNNGIVTRIATWLSNVTTRDSYDRLLDESVAIKGRKRKNRK